MKKRVVLSKLERTCYACPSQWEYFENGFGAYVRFRHNRLSVYVNQEPVNDFLDCLDEQNIVLCVDHFFDDSREFDSGYLTNEELVSILKKHDLLEEE